MIQRLVSRLRNIAREDDDDDKYDSFLDAVRRDRGIQIRLALIAGLVAVNVHTFGLAAAAWEACFGSGGLLSP